MIQFVSKLETPTTDAKVVKPYKKKGKGKQLDTKKKLEDVYYRFGAYGSNAVAIAATQVHSGHDKGIVDPFRYKLMPLRSTPHEPMTEFRKQELIDLLRGQPFPTLGVHNIRPMLLSATNCNDLNPECVADHVIVLACWDRCQGTQDTWTVMQQCASVTLVNLNELEPLQTPDGAPAPFPSLQSVWWVNENTAIHLAKKVRFAKKSGFKTQPFTETSCKVMTPYEKAYVQGMRFLKEKA